MARSPSQWAYLHADFERYLALYPGHPRHSFRKRVKVALAEEAFWTLYWYRFGRWARTELSMPVVKPLCLVLYRVMFRILRVAYGISIPAEVEAGPGLYFGHFGGVWINPQVRLGRNVSILHGVTIGLGGQGAVQGVPVIGDDVFIGPNATITGRLTVGNGCVIGANSLVVGDVPDGATAVGVPARVLMKGANPISARPSATPSATPSASISDPDPARHPGP